MIKKNVKINDFMIKLFSTRAVVKAINSFSRLTRARYADVINCINALITNDPSPIVKRF